MHLTQGVSKIYASKIMGTIVTIDESRLLQQDSDISLWHSFDTPTNGNNAKPEKNTQDKVDS